MTVGLQNRPPQSKMEKKNEAAAEFHIPRLPCFSVLSSVEFTILSGGVYIQPTRRRKHSASSNATKSAAKLAP